MSRLRRLVLSDRYFFVTCKVLPACERLSEADFALLAGSIQSRRRQHQFLLTAWVFLPDPAARRGMPSSCHLTPAPFQ